MSLENYSRVRLLTDRFSGENLPRDSVGYVIEVYPDKYEIEFSDGNGITIGQIVAREDEIELYPESSTQPLKPAMT